MFLGVDVGSVSTNIVLWSNGEVLNKVYLRTMGQPIRAIKLGMAQVSSSMGDDIAVKGVGVTGSGRRLAGVILGADVIKNEITAHGVAAMQQVPGVQTVLEIGGQDSKLTILRNSVVNDFAMNTVCAAGTGSFLDQQAARLSIPIDEFGPLALKSQNPVRIAGRCAVFAESDMIHKQQMGHRIEDILAGLCEALVRNYLNNLAKGKTILPVIAFQGGVAANVGMRRAFEAALGQPVVVPEHFDVMGALGAALLTEQWYTKNGQQTSFKGFGDLNAEYQAGSFECSGCSNLCEVVDVKRNGQSVARWGDRCGKWQFSQSSKDAVNAEVG